MAEKYPKYGTRRLTHQLRRKPYSYRVNRKRIQRLARQNDLLRLVKRRKTRTTDSQNPYPRYENMVKGLKIDLMPLPAVLQGQLIESNLLPKERWLASFCQSEKAQRRRVLVCPPGRDQGHPGAH